MNNPRHIGIIMDGNRRFAKERALEPWKGHEKGKEQLDNVLAWCEELDLRELTLYAFSMQNFKRAPVEVEQLMRLFREGIKEFIAREDEWREKGIRIRFIGRLHLFAEDIQTSMDEVMRLTAENDHHILNVAVAYGGKEEIEDAVRQIAQEVADGTLSVEAVDAQAIEERLYMQGEPDMIIRTGGARRTSNFLLWQSSYAEWFFVEKYWPAFTREDFMSCVEEYRNRERRFGK